MADGLGGMAFGSEASLPSTYTRRRGNKVVNGYANWLATTQTPRYPAQFNGEGGYYQDITTPGDCLTMLVILRRIQAKIGKKAA